ncbi:PP2C family protein-serine/threonine phosphatase [Blastococcus litoris]|uniref:PP2C family protein-serine/threonine phosphatase n=1 Tax=Blastococcus litoris TaxID=2171622 RepID=UPI000E307927|nr:PP2C family protein-serine/threonine phosphatase [Blastococcus litoris]
MSIVVAVLLLAITGVLAFLTWRVTTHGEERLLDRQLAQVGSLLSTQAAVLQVQLADVGAVAVNTNANPGSFARFGATQLEQTGQSLSLWRVTDGRAEQLAVQGVDPVLPGNGSQALTALQPDGQLVILGILPGEPRRLAYGLMPAEGAGDLLVYAESPLPDGEPAPVDDASPLAGLDLALYLGTQADPDQLLQATAPTPIDGDPQRTAVPFGNTTVTVVGASDAPLSGPLAAALPWIVLGVGCALAVGAVTVVEFVSRRRALAEGLAAENDRLYRQQRGIAGTLQHALLPVLPELTGLEAAARYVAGVDELAVGGDWYDVIEVRPGCVVFVVGDVSGRGLPAATTMAALRFAVRAYLAEGHCIETVLAKLRCLLDIDTEHQFATVLLGQLDASAGRLRLVSAGHFGPMLVTGDGARLVDCPVSPPVGVPSPVPPTAVTVDVPGTATLLAFTDGAVERSGEVIDDGLDRLRSAAAAAAARPLPAMLDDLMSSLVDGGKKDDTVILAMRWTGAAPTRA